MTSATDHFQLFGFEPAHQIDLAALDAAYDRLSLENHPDFFATAAEEQKQDALNKSAALNEGYRVLRSEPLRAAHLLQLRADGAGHGNGHGKGRGAKGGNGNGAARPLDTTHLPPGFLQEMFALQELLDDLEQRPDAARATAVKEQAEQGLAAIRTERAELFGQARHADEQETLQAIQTNLNREKYLLRLLERLAEEPTANLET